MSDAAGPPENAELSTDQTKSLRVACKQEIPREAKVCASCKSYQADWKNRLQYFSGTVSLLAIAAAAVTWLSSQLSTTFQPDNVKLISFDSTGSAVIANFGPREVFVSNLHMYMLAGQPIWQGEIIAFNERAVPGQFIERKIKEGNDQRQLVMLQGLSATDFEKRLTQANSDENCFQLAFYSKDDYSLKEIVRVAGDKLNTFPVSGDLQYWGMGSQEAKSIPINGTGILYEDNRRECAGRYPFLHG
jgi:hypothetical protein